MNGSKPYDFAGIDRSTSREFYGAPFPTPSLSPGESVNQTQCGEQSRVHSVPLRECALFPLPEGDDQGEGNGANENLGYRPFQKSSSWSPPEEPKVS